MSGGQIDSLCRDWLDENYDEEIVSQYTIYSLVIPQRNSADLNDVSDHLRLMLSRAFGPEQSFGSTDYYEAREGLGLPDRTTLVPDVLVTAFARN